VAVFSFGLIAAGLLLLFFQAVFQNETKPAA
jgi:hypothetical protein